MKKLILGISMVAVATVGSSADLITPDSFETYTDQTALLAAWPESTPANPDIILMTDGGHTGDKYVRQTAIVTGETVGGRIYKNIASTIPTDANPLSVEFWIRTPDASVSGARSYVGLGQGASVILEYGFYRPPEELVYKARIVGGVPNPTTWAVVGGTPVSNEWAKLRAEVGSMDAKFFVNDVLINTFTRTASPFVAINRVYIGSNITTTLNVDFDDVKVYTAANAAVNDWSVY